MTKMIRCPQCLELNKPEDWDEETYKVFGPSAELILNRGHEELWFICPACKEQVDSVDVEEEEEIPQEYGLIVQTGFVTDSLEQVHEMYDCILSGGECKTQDILTAQAIETMLLINEITYVKNVYWDKEVRVFNFSV